MYFPADEHSNILMKERFLSERRSFTVSENLTLGMVLGVRKGAMSQHHLEIERKYELEDVHAPLPEIPWQELDGFYPQDPVIEEMDATYFDTADQALGRARVAVRRRIGGYDQGWHIKFDDGKGSRHEVHFALLTQQKRQPAAVGNYLKGLTVGAELVETVSIATHRVRTVVLDQQQKPIGEICQDSVRAFNYAQQQERAWNEWEVELLNPESPEVESFFDQCEFLLADAGARPSRSAAKIARALGQDVEFESRLKGGKQGKKKKSKSQKFEPVKTSAVVERMLVTSLQNLGLSDLKVRGGDSAAIVEFAETAQRLQALVRFGVAPYLDDSEAVKPTEDSLASLVGPFVRAEYLKFVQQEVAELATQKKGSKQLSSGFDLLQSNLAQMADSLVEELQKYLQSSAYLEALKSIYRVLEIVRDRAEFPLNPENYFNKVNKRIRKTLLAYRSEGISQELLHDVESAFRAFEALEGSSISWTACQLELRANVIEMAQRVQEVSQQREVQRWCEFYSENTEGVEALALGFVWGQSSYYETGLTLGLASFMRQELSLLKKIKLK